MIDPLLRNLRRNMTDAERRLWSKLRNKATGFRFRRQHRLGRFVVDFVCLERRLVVEVDGGQHNQRSNLESDARRTMWLNEAGYQVLRVWNNDVLLRTDDVLENILAALKDDSGALPPSP
jgi:very-short-patch-repair endonuclease